MSIPRKNTPRKEKSAGNAGTFCQGRQNLPRNDGGGGLTAPLRGTAGFTAEELAELARADAEIDDEEIFLTPEERALSRALDRATKEARLEKRRARDAAARARETPEQRAARLAKEKAWREANRERLRAQSAAYNAAHRQERRDYQKAYDAAHREEIRAKGRARYAAHREEINARRREKYAAKRAAGKRKEGNNGREI